MCHYIIDYNVNCFELAKVSPLLLQKLSNDSTVFAVQI